MAAEAAVASGLIVTVVLFLAACGGAGVGKTTVVTETCDLDWTGFVLDETSAQPECAGDSVYDEGAPVLAYGEHWAKGSITCDSREAGLRCQNGSGHGFTLARGSSASF